MQTVTPCRWYEVATVRDGRGILSHLEEGNGLPFPVKRVFFIRGVPPNAKRSGHVTHNCDQLLFAAGGCFTLSVRRDGVTEDFEVNDNGRGLYLPAGYWRRVGNFSAGAVCLVLASETYGHSGYSYEP